ncbi:MAG: UDP-3-O-(3-hydroxymyristoyl)glucosamine N-acyltransferase [Muribaculaceae bacterium]|nr:UDP-3-O-(3-hydroxymyristoyl)glucosamine N-acyltransferase [Muribaculaceae bacterium]MDE6610311.1 UDP-3-O-(3-hydroxymyristoyl)glucosamine N-acyltransferase [Muribaculaceae bacterium]
MQFSAEQIAQMIGGRVEGDPSAMVSTLSKIEEGCPGSISFLANPKYTPHIYDTEASVVLVADSFEAEHPVKPTLIRVPDPYAAMTGLLEMVAKAMVAHPTGTETPSHIGEGTEVPEDAYIGAFAYIGCNVKLGKGVKIYPQVYVGDNCEIGDGAVLYAGSKVYYGCKIGKRCILHSGVVVGADGFGFAPVNGHYQKIPQLGIVEIGDDVEIGANTTVDRATMGATRIGAGTKLDNLIQIAHNVEVGDDTVMAAQVGIAGSSKIGSSCRIGGQVGIAGHIRIGDDVEIGAQAGLQRNVRNGSRVIGSPAVDIGDFARQVVYIKNLERLNRRVDALEKKEKNKQV